MKLELYDVRSCYNFIYDYSCMLTFQLTMYVNGKMGENEIQDKEDIYVLHTMV